LCKEEENVAADEEEHLAILTSLPELQADELSNAIPTHGGLKFGKRKSKER
jgi:hypothetical protein